MKEIKDNFSGQSALYAKFRPSYPSAIFDHLYSFLPNSNLAWDCATGNGQMAVHLSKQFCEVIATDISRSQIEKAPRKENISYRHERAENSSLATESVDLITVAQAIHWLDFNAFYTEAKRVLNKEGIIAIIGYPLLRTEKSDINKLVLHFYRHIIGKYWDPERKYIDDRYTTVPFPFEEISLPKFEMKYRWKLEELLGYFGSWSAVAHYREKNGIDPVGLIRDELEIIQPKEEYFSVYFEIIGKVGRKGISH